jgi:nucleoside-diphosphate-sugar epimerase
MILVTGATGTVGRQTVSQLLATGAEVRPARWEDVPPDAVRAGLAAAFGDASFADHALDAWARFVEEPELVTSTVERITGAPARTFREWASDHAGDFR